MANQTSIINRALAAFGSRTTITAAELASNGSNEAIQANLIYFPFLRRLQRMAPWSCVFNTAQLQYITSVYGTPENPTAQATTTINGQQVSIWAKGQPAPPWAYEYQYPADCIRACWVVPQTATGYASGIPITTAVTGGAPSYWQGPPVKFAIGADQFYNSTGAAIISGGTGYAVGDLVTLEVQLTVNGANNLIGNFQPSAPQGAAPVYQVTEVGAGGSITAVIPFPLVTNEDTVYSGSLFYEYQTPPVAQASTTGAGSGATFNPIYGGPATQRVINTNQEFAILNYCQYNPDPNLWDDDFQEAFVQILGSGLVRALTGDKVLANAMIQQTNEIIKIARADDANEGLKVNDVLPDFIRVRGIAYTEDYSGPYNTGFDWGSLWPGFN